MKNIWNQIFIPLVALGLGLFAAAGVCWAVGESPLLVMQVLAKGAFGSPTNLGYSLFYATPLIFTGLSVSWAFRLGLFNIGAEGQMGLGGIAIFACAFALRDSSPWIVWPLALLSGFFVGGLWGAIAGWMKAYRGAHEVLATLLLNFVSYGILSILIASVFRNLESQAPETLPLPESLRFAVLSLIGGTSPLNGAIYLGVVTVFAFWLLSEKTIFGFRQRLVGGAPGTALRTGLNVKGQIVLGMFLSGGLAALAASSEVLGYSLKVREGFMGGAGFVGIAVALLGRNKPLGIVISAVLFGALQKGALELDLDTEKVSRDLSYVIQAFIILGVVSEKGLRELVANWRRFLPQRKQAE